MWLSCNSDVLPFLDLNVHIKGFSDAGRVEDELHVSVTLV